LSDWDAATHMSRGEWRTTCNRVATERGAFMLVLDQGQEQSALSVAHEN
jgi:hypothetical protein